MSSTAEGVERSDREYPSRPIVGVGVVVVKGDDVLVIQRGSHPGYGQWSIPGGAVELGETVREAAIREVAEECGIAIDITDVVEVIDRVVRDGEGRVQYHYVLVDFAGRYLSGQVVAASDILQARWVPIADVGRVGITELTLAVIMKALDRLGVRRDA